MQRELLLQLRPVPNIVSDSENKHYDGVESWVGGFSLLERSSNLDVFMASLSAGPSGVDWEWGSYQSACEAGVEDVIPIEIDMDQFCFTLEERETLANA